MDTVQKRMEKSVFLKEGNIKARKGNLACFLVYTAEKKTRPTELFALRVCLLVYPLGFEPRLDGVGGRNVIQLHYEYII